MDTLIHRHLPNTARTFRRAFALVLGLGLLAVPASAQALNHGDHNETDHAFSDDYVVVVGPNGDAVCQLATPDESLALRAEPTEPLNLTVFPSTNDEQDITGMRILLRATDQILEFPDALYAFRRAAARWERAITDPITVIIDVDFGPRRFGGSTYAPTTLASATNGGRRLNGAGPAEVVDFLKAQHPGDAQLQALYDAIPIPTPSTAGEPLQTAIFSRPLAQAFGLLPPTSDPNPNVNPFGEFATIGFNAAFTWDTDPSDGVAGADFDFEGVAVHEMGHSLGFTSIIGTGGPPDNTFSILDFFRVRPDAVEPGEPLDDGEGWEVAERVVTPGPAGTTEVVQVFFDGLRELPLSTSAGNGTGGDGNQASHWRDDGLGTPFIGIMDPNFARGTTGDLNSNDLRAMEVIGFNVIYNAPRSDVAVTVQDVPYDTTPQDSIRFFDIGDFTVGDGGELVVELENTSGDVSLDYEAEILFEYVAPQGAVPAVDFEGTNAGTIAPGETGEVTVSVNADEAFVFYGTLVIETNAEDNLVVDIPFTFSVGGGTAPNLEVAEDIGDLGNAAEGQVLVGTFDATNTGTVALDYRAAVSLARRSLPFSTEPDIGTRALARGGIAPLFSENFDDGDLGAFTAGGSFPGDWQVIDFGPVDLEGHSQPNAAYFGEEGVTDPEDLQYRNQAVGRLVSPSIDLSATAQADLVVLTFNTYLQAEEGFDFASVLVSLDDGESYIEVATSDDGILQNTDDGWEAIEIELPLLSGYDAPARFAFQFITDTFVTDVGWFIDDVVLTVRPGENPIFVNPTEGTIAGDSSEEISVTVQGATLERGFYRGEVVFVSNSFELSDAGVPLGFTDDNGLRFIGREESVEFTFTVAGPEFPVLVPEEEVIAVTFTAFGGQEEEIEVSNGGDASLTFVRLLEPALGQYSDERLALRFADTEQRPDRKEVELDPRAERTVQPGRTLNTTALRGGPEPDSLGVALVPATGRLATDIAQFPDGRIVVLDGGGPRAFVYERNFWLDGVSAEPTIYALPSFFDNDNPTSLTYNENTESFWIGTAQRNRLYEVRFPPEGTDIARTGQSVGLGFVPSSTDYSPELDAYFAIEYGTPMLHAVGSDGVELPGYPVETAGDSFYRGLSMTGGLAEIGSNDRISGDAVTYTSFDQFANEFDNELLSTTTIEVPLQQLLARRINGLLRSHIRPNDVMYYVSDAGGGGTARLLAVDPPDLPESYFVNNIEAADGSPLYGKELAPDEAKMFTVVFNGDGLESDGMIQDTLAFLTNNPEDRVVRIPVELTVTNVANEGEAGLPTAFALRQNYPNPFATRTRLVFDLPTTEQVTLSVYNVLGQRVAVLKDGDLMEAGTQEIPFDASRLASGTYVVRLQAGDYVGTQRLTLVK